MRGNLFFINLKKIENLSDQIRQDIMDVLNGKKLCIYFDGKQVRQIEKDLNITVTVERIAIFKIQMTSC